MKSICCFGKLWNIFDVVCCGCGCRYVVGGEIREGSGCGVRMMKWITYLLKEHRSKNINVYAFLIVY